MTKQVPCFICGIGAEAKDERAIVKLCEEHNTTQNSEEMRNTPVHQLLRRYSDFLQVRADEMSGDLSQTKDEYLKIQEELKAIHAKIDGLPQPSVPTDPQTNTGQINEFGECV